MSDIEDIYELSPLQQGMLLHSAHDGASDMYLSQQIYTAEGPLDADALVQAWGGVLTDHPALRATFHWQGLEKPLQVVHRNVNLPVFHHDWSDLSEEEQARQLHVLRREDRATGLDLTTAPLQRVTLIRIGPSRHYIVWTYHHLLMDGWSVPLFMGGLLNHYRYLTGHGQPPPPPPPPFRTYIGWLQQQDPDATKDFWRETLGGISPAHQLPLVTEKAPDDSGPMDLDWARRTMVLPAELVEALHATAASNQVTVNTVIQAAWAIVLSSYSGHPDTVFGCPSSGRPLEVPDADHIIGVFANTLPMRVTVPPQGELGPWLRDIQQTYAAMRRYEYTPLSDVKKWAGVPGQQMFQSLLSLENYPSAIDAGGTLSFRREGIYDTINYPIGISVMPATGTIMLGINQTRFPPGSIDDILTRLCDTLESVVTKTDVADLVSAAGPTLVSDRAPTVSPVVDDEGPSDPFERTIAQVYEEVLGVTPVDPTASFFDLGGDSFDAVRAISRINGATVGLLAANPSARELANALAVPALDPHAPDEVVEAPPAPVFEPLPTVPRDRPLVCTYQQEGAWFMNQFNPLSTVFHVPFALRLKGKLDVPAMERAICALVARHEALRTRFVNHGGLPRQVIDPPPTALRLPMAELKPAQIYPWAAAQGNRPFDLAKGPVVRIAAAKIGPDEHLLVMVLHHIISDGWSAGILGRELSALYGAEAAGRSAALPPLVAQPADYAAWQRQWLTGEELDRQLGFWRDTLTGLSTVDFPTDRPRPAQPTGAGNTVGRAIPADVAADVRAYVRAHRVSLLAVLQAALLTVLNRYTGQVDLPVGSIFSGRTRPDIEPLVGYFGNILVLRTDAGGRPTFAELVRRCHQTIVDATVHQDVPFRLVVDALQPERVTGRNPLFQIGLTLLPTGIAADLTLGDVTGEVVGIPEHYALYDISVDVADSVDGPLDLAVEYSTELFDADRMVRFMDHYATALANGLAAPDTAVDDVDLISAAEREQVLQAASYPAEPLHRLVAAVAARTPDAVALIDHDGMRTTYRQLDVAANRLANRLRGRGVERATPVGVCLRPGDDLVIALLAIWKAGGRHVLLDPSPTVEPAFVVTTSNHAAMFTSALAIDTERDDTALQSARPPTGDSTLDDVAGVLQSDVLVSHRTLTEQVTRLPEIFGLQAGDRVLHTTPYGFSGAVRDLFWPLVAGATVVIADPSRNLDAGYLYRTAARTGVTVLHLRPTTLQAMLELPSRGVAGLRRVCVSGEALTAKTLKQFRAAWPTVELYNVWSSAETADVTAGRYEPGTDVGSVGHPLRDRRVYVLDDNLRPVPVGVAGHLYVGGAGLALGYLGRPGLTAGRFVPDPFTGRRMFATGDQARWRTDGVLEHLGRADRQVMLRGQRIELDRIEDALAGHPAVRRSAVVLRDGAGLVAYVVGSVSSKDVRSYLVDRLPANMVPAGVVVLPELPLTPVGKLDRAALPEPHPTAAASVAPRTATERWIAATWQNLLGVESVGTTDNVFDLGANSLHVTQIVAALRDGLHVDLHVRQVFANPTLGQLAAAVDDEAGMGARLRRSWWIRRWAKSDRRGS